MWGEGTIQRSSAVQAGGVVAGVVCVGTGGDETVVVSFRGHARMEWWGASRWEPRNCRARRPDMDLLPPVHRGVI